MEYATTVQYTLLVNGHITQSLTPHKRLRQRDPLSPYLFLLCANILSIAFMRAKACKDIKGVKLGRNGVSFTHPLFADDSLLFFKNDSRSLTKIQSILAWYCSISSQAINLAKSNLFCSPNIPMEDQQALAQTL